MSALELLCLPLALGLTALVLRRHSTGARLGLPISVGAVLALAQIGWQLSKHAPTPPGSPRTDPGAAYGTSNSCKSCHPSEYASWHDSYHRSMTEAATRSTMRAPWRGVELEYRDRQYRLFERAGEFWANLPDPDLMARAATSPAALPPPNVDRRVLMTTGSHHYQAYWVPGARGNELWQLPFVYHFESRRFIPRHAAFLQPESDPEHQARWNSNCVQCHSVGGRPRHDAESDRFDTSVVELGIACEACHGPGARHIAKHQNPFDRYRASADGAADASIVNPARLDAERASEVCGQCHAYFVPRDAERWWSSGFADSFRPGDALERSRHVIDYESDSEHASELLSSSLDSLFYADGTIRVGGREWNGLRRSACFERGRGATQLSCLSCHAMHGQSRDDQLRAGDGNAALCGSCHGELVTDAVEHSHHDVASSGNLCVSCHMPLTTYALFKGIRSHRITRPDAAAELSGMAATPNACNGCHLNQSLAWTAQWLERWYGRERPSPASAELAELPRGAVGVLAGDAATRVVFAYALGQEPAQRASGLALPAQLLVAALDDPYAAVRFVAHRSLRTLPDFRDFQFDFIADRQVRLASQVEAEQRLSQQSLSADVLQQLMSQRDSTPIRIAE